VHANQVLDVPAPGLLANDTDADGDTLMVAGYTVATHGTLVVRPDGSFTYTPDAGFVGVETITYTIYDGFTPDYTLFDAIPIGTGTFTITVTNEAPVAADDVFETPEDVTLIIPVTSLLGNDIDAGGDTLAFLGFTQPSKGSLVDNGNGTLTYTPSANFNGPDSFTYSIGDGIGGSDTASVVLTVNPVNDAPVLDAVSDKRLQAGETLSLDMHAMDPDQPDVLSYALVSGPAGMTVDATSGLLGWTAPYLDAFSVFPVTVQVSDALGAVDQQTFDVVVDPNLLQVTSFASTHTGFKLRFNQPFDTGRINLYSARDNPMGLADIHLSRSDGAPVMGSVVLDDDRMGLTFIKTGGVLASDTYTVRVDSRTDAFVDGRGRLLDGDANDVAGADFETSFTVSGGGGILGIGDIVRGPGQALNSPTTSVGLPVIVSNAAGATKVAFTLIYNPALLSVSAAGLSAGLPAGTTLSADVSVAGRVRVTLSLGGPVGAGALELVRLTAQVPVLAPYGGKQVLELESVQINDGAMAVRDDDGLHVAAYFGDASGNGSYSALDLQRLRRVILTLDSGFGAYPMMDPKLMADINGDGAVDMRDVQWLLQEITGRDRVEIPPIPRGFGPLNFSGADPLLAIGTVSARAGSMVSVPVTLDTAAGLEALQLIVAYPPDQVTLLTVRLAGVAEDFDWLITDNGTPGRVVVDASRLEPLVSGTGTVLELVFKVSRQAMGAIPIDMQWAMLNDSHLTLSPTPAPGPDATDGQIQVWNAKGKHSWLQSDLGWTPSTDGQSAHSAWLSNWLAGSNTESKKKGGWKVKLSGK